MTGVSSVRAAVQVGAGRIEVHEFARPKVDPDAALVRIEACGLCGTDVAQYRGVFAERGWADLPCIPGHEPLGVIDEIGSVAAARWGLAIGDRVAVEPHLSRGVCDACLAGSRTACEAGEHRSTNYGFMSTERGPGLWGGYSEYLYIDPRTVLHKMSKSIPASIATLFNPLGAGFSWAYHAPSMRFGDTVVILGSGQRGLACVVAARAAGAGLIVVTDIAAAAAKLDLALAFGADHVVVADEEDPVQRVAEVTSGRLADVVVDVTAEATKPVTDAIAMVKRGGVVVLAGSKSGQAIPDFFSDDLVRRSITMRGVFTVDSSSYVRAIRLLEAGHGALAAMHSVTYPLDEAAAAVARLAGTDGEPSAVHVSIEPWLDR
jgi:threonine dehydrogenase-like Zn-dependent dehydrogenase